MLWDLGIRRKEMLQQLRILALLECLCECLWRLSEIMITADIIKFVNTYELIVVHIAN